MKNIILTISIIIIFFGINGCNNKRSDSGNIQFEYFFRGFIPVTNRNREDFPVGELIIETEDDWIDYMNKYCSGIPYFIKIDFPEECLIAMGYFGAKSTYNTSTEIEYIRIKDDKIEIKSINNYSDWIYAMNKDNVGHWYLTIIKVKRKDLPIEIDENK
jgi:hypothetical protein